MKKILFFVTVGILLTGCKNDTKNSAVTEGSPQTGEATATKIAMAYGYENFDDVKQINFSFNVKINDTIRSSRTWNWYPQEERVELIENGESFSYEKDGEFDETETAADQKFINDTYWFLFPYQLVWSEYESDFNRMAVAPISQQEMQQLTVKYAGDGGYTPGDTYHLFVNEDNIIEEWTFESSEGRTLTTTWEDLETFNGITIAKSHKTEDGSFELFFDNIEVIK